MITQKFKKILLQNILNVIAILIEVKVYLCFLSSFNFNEILNGSINYIKL